MRSRASASGRLATDRLVFHPERRRASTDSLIAWRENPNPQTGNFTLRSHSPAIDSGWSAADAGAQDRAGRRRRSGHGLDLGAHEVQQQASFGPGETLIIDDRAGDGRFEVTLYYDSVLGGGTSGWAKAVRLNGLGITRGGLLYFNDPSNPEVLIKILDACALTDSYWVFYAATTTLGFELTVSDTVSVETLRYRNTDRQPATPVTDTARFETCSG